MDTATGCDTFHRVKSMVADLGDVPETRILPTHSLQHDLHLDSLDRVELVMFLEDDFDIIISDEDAEACDTVAEVVALVTRKLSGN